MVLAVAESAGRVGLWPLGSVVYSQSTTRSPTKHRDDCSGFVCMILGLPTPGLSTVGLRDLVDPIPASDIRRGDLLGNLGAGTEGNAGHVQWVDSVSPTGAVTVYEQTGGSAGPHHNTYKRPGFQAWRVRGAIDTGPTIVEADEMLYAVNAPNDPGVWLSNGLQRRGLSKLAELEGWLNQGPTRVIRYTGVDLSWYGEPIITQAQIEAAITRVLAKLPTGSGGGLTAEQIGAVVRTELDKTRLIG